MSGLMTEKLDELFSALVENKPITHAQIHRAKSEYQVLRAVAQKAEQQKSVQKQPTPQPAIEGKNVLQDGSVTCPYCKQAINKEAPEEDHYHNRTNELQVEIFQLKQEIHRKNRQIKDLEDRQKRQRSKISAAALSDNPNVIDLSDPNRSLKIGERYSELYDNEWTDAFYYLENSVNVREDKILDMLQRILRAAYEFCNEVATAQLMNMEGEILCPLSTWTENKRIENMKKKTSLSKESKQVAKQFRKTTSTESIPTIQQIFLSQVLPEFVEINTDTEQKVQNYAKMCVQVTWYMCIQDPPMHLVSKVNRKSTFDTNIFRFYTKNGDKFDYVVWPALLLHENGPLVTKGVAQPYDPMNKSVSGSKPSLRSPKENFITSPIPVQMRPPANPRRDNDSVELNPGLRGTPWGSQNLSIAGTESVDLPPMPELHNRVPTPRETLPNTTRQTGSREKSKEPNLTAAWRKNTPIQK